MMINKNLKETWGIASKIRGASGISNSNFNEVEVEVKVEEKKKCLKFPVFTKKYGKFQGFSLTSALTLTWQFSK